MVNVYVAHKKPPFHVKSHPDTSGQDLFYSIHVFHDKIIILLRLGHYWSRLLLLRIGFRKELCRDVFQFLKLLLHDHIGFFNTFLNNNLSLSRGLVAQRITRLTTDQKIAGSNPAEFGRTFFVFKRWFHDSNYNMPIYEDRERSTALYHRVAFPAIKLLSLLFFTSDQSRSLSKY